MSAIAEAPSRNGDGPKLDPTAYRVAVKARMEKYEVRPDGSKKRAEPSEAEVDQFLVECQLYGLEPLSGQIYAVWEKGAMRAVTTIDGLRALAERTQRYDGQNDPEWCDEEGNWTDYWSGKQFPVAARVRVHKKGTKVPTTGTANWKDFAPSVIEEGALWSMSGGKPAHMLSIRSEAVALRKAFPAELSGLYTAEELGISLTAIGAGAEQTGSSPAAAAVDVPASPSPGGSGHAAPSTPAAPVPLPMPPVEVAEPGPAVIVDPAEQQPSGPPASPKARRSLSEVLASSEYERLRGDLTKVLFDQLPDRLTDRQSEGLAALVVEAEEAGITPVELERLSKIALKGEGPLSARAQALREWIGERRRKAAEEAESATADRDQTASAEGEAQDSAESETATPTTQVPSLLDDEEPSGGEAPEHPASGEPESG